ncbi:MAG: mandelate racemase/muconate lactonizing enzyme family protein, partial [Bacteroidota bacterium]
DQPVLDRALFPAPVQIAKLELLRYEQSYLCRVTAQDGSTGISVSNNLRMDYLYPIFLKRVAPFFVGKDARDLDQLTTEVYRWISNYKMQSYAVGVPVATVEFAILDLLGKQAGKSIGALLGPVVNQKVGIYLATRFRNRPAVESVALAQEKIAAGGYRAVKFKIGEKMGANTEPIVGRTEELIPFARRAFGPDIWLGVDANGGYDVENAIRIGRLLQDNNYAFFEEPVPFDWYRESRQVAASLDIPLAGGEQEASMRNFRWLVAEGTLGVYRQDMFYFGGMIRSLKVARMAAAAGYSCVPHLSGSGLGYLYALHFVSALPNAGPYHPSSRDDDHPIPIECSTSSLRVEDGFVTVPTGPGLGVEIDPEFIEKHQLVQG